MFGERMASVDPAYRNLIQFVPQKAKGSTEDKFLTVKRDKTQHKGDTGDDIRNFYESLIQDKAESKLSSSSRGCRKHTTTKHYKRRKGNKCPPVNDNSSTTSVAGDGQAYRLKTDKKKVDDTNPVERPGNIISYSAQVPSRKERQHLKLLQAAQFGNMNEVSELLKQELDIDYKDFFGWTPLMCAAKEGHHEMVKYLLKCGADYMIENSDGQTAFLLASSAGHAQLAEEILNYSCASSPSVEKEKNLVETFLCQICNAEFSAMEETSHNTSTLHLFNMGHKPRGPSYLIPETNRGFQMLLRTGWEVDKGLGPMGTGNKYPVKTVLKHDRTGLGASESSKKKAKVTHFNPKDKSAIDRPNEMPIRKMTARKAARIALKAKERKAKRVEQKLRWELNADFH